MEKKRILIFGMFLLSVIVISGLAKAVPAISYCCEKSGNEFCLDVANPADCDTSGDYKGPQPTSCYSTSYCKLGTCVNADEGTCMPNTPLRICNEEGGIWKEGLPSDHVECGLGCCLIGDQAAFVTGVKCSKMAILYGLNIIFRADIKNEVDCINSARAESRGACVFEDEKEFTVTCKMMTKTDCDTLGKTAKGVSFNEGLLCTNSELKTNCKPSSKTTCVDGKDEVYFLDSCGNIANIYDSAYTPLPSGSGQNDDYWQKIYAKSESCAEGSNINADCGNCDYYSGSTCKVSNGVAKCSSLDCQFEGKKYLHGETWCATSNPASKSKGVSNIIVGSDGNLEKPVLKLTKDSSGKSLPAENVPGSRYFRMVCYNGEVTVEPCADFRQEICIEGKIVNPRTNELDLGPNGFSAAVCRVNRWQDCIYQKNKDACEDNDLRDCVWSSESYAKILCFPRFTPGLKFWSDSTTASLNTGVNSSGTGLVRAYTPSQGKGGTSSEADSVCALASTSCTASYEKNIADIWAGYSGKKIGGGCFNSAGSFSSGWENRRKLESELLGDCGIKDNFLGTLGSNKEGIGLNEKVNKY